MLDDNLVKDINHLIDSKSGAELWQDAVKLAIKNNPVIAEEVYLTVKQNREERESLKDAKYGTSQTKAFRRALRYPQSILDILCLVDPDNFPASNDKKGEKTIKRMMKAFPEFTIASTI